jgi:hypothetical protein
MSPGIDTAIVAQFHQLQQLFAQHNLAAVAQVAGKILNHQRSDAASRLCAATIHAELARENEQYEEAETLYSRAIEEGRGDIGGALEAFALHYHPRAYLGLITVLRRELCPDTDKISNLISGYRRTFLAPDAHPRQDSEAQIDAVEGVFLRQLGDSTTALNKLTAAAKAMSKMRLDYFQFWHPDHIDGHRVLVCMTAPALTIQGRHDADVLLRRPDIDDWSRAVGLAAKLHFQLDDALYETSGSKAVRASLTAGGSAVLKWLDELARAGNRSGNPTLATESLMLRATWHAASGEHTVVAKCLAELARSEVDPNLALLRGIEAAVLVEGWPAVRSEPAVQLCKVGQRALQYLSERLERYNYAVSDIEWCRELLGRAANSVGAGGRPKWSPPELVSLRARIWP